MLAADGLTATDATSGRPTLNEALPDTLPTVALMVAAFGKFVALYGLFGTTPLATPAAVTVATPTFADDHVTFLRGVRALPSMYFPLAANARVSPFFTKAGLGDTVMVAPVLLMDPSGITVARNSAFVFPCGNFAPKSVALP